MDIQRFLRRLPKRSSATPRGARRRVGDCEQLEPRLLLYAANGGVWPHPELITVSFMPDGTDIGGVPSDLVSTMNQRWSTGVWQKEILRGLQSYAEHSAINFSVASDDGSAFGSAGGSGSDNNMQGDSNFGDVRIGGFALGGALGLSMLPPPINGDSTAGDFFLNTTTIWNIGSTFDLFTVSAHEAGHSIGLDHSLVTTAVMFDVYNGVKSSLTSDDISGIQSIYGARPHDSFDAGAGNNSKGDATVITSYIDSNKQITLTNLDVTTRSDIDWYKVTTPSGSASTMTVRVQSSGLSLLAPRISVYKGSTFKGTVAGDYNSVVSFSSAIGNGQNWFIKVDAAESTAFGTGDYALQVNMGTAALPLVSTPNTATPSNGLGGYGVPNQAGGFGEVFVAAPETSSSTESGEFVVSRDGNSGEDERFDSRTEFSARSRTSRGAATNDSAAVDQLFAPTRRVSVESLDEAMSDGDFDSILSGVLRRKMVG